VRFREVIVKFREVVVRLREVIARFREVTVRFSALLGSEIRFLSAARKQMGHR